ncbi:MAG: MBL fold metallo-hydrolase [Nanoarchaeota archaeon]
MRIQGIDIQRLSHASFILKGSRTIYIDPFQIAGSPEPADFILISHEHYDHCSSQDVKKVITPETIIVTVPDCMSKLNSLNVKEIKIVNPGDQVNYDKVHIEAVPAYNIGKPFHPKDNDWIGFIVTMDNVRIYHAGDTDLIPEMKKIDVDIALLPVSGKYVMTAEEAAQATTLMKVKTAIPMHYGAIVGTNDDAERFKKLCTCKVEIL